MNRYRAAREGAEEIYFAVIATSVTLAFVFLPIIFLQGFVGRLFREFGVVIAAAVLISSFVSLTLTPILNVWLTSKTPKAPSKFYQWSAPFFEAMDRFYRGSLRSFMQKSWLVFPLLGITGLGTALLYQSLPQELAPSEDRSISGLSFLLPKESATNTCTTIWTNWCKSPWTPCPSIP